MKLIKNTFFALCLFCASSVFSEVINPVEDFIMMYGDVSDEEIICMFCVDLNGDGIDEVFLSRKKDRNARLGNIWTVYASQHNKFVRSDRLISVFHNSLILRKSVDKEQYRLFSLTSPNKGEFLLMEFFLSKTDILSRKIANITIADEKWSDTILSLLMIEDENEFPIIKEKAQELKRYISAQSKAAEEKTKKIVH